MIEASTLPPLFPPGDPKPFPSKQLGIRFKYAKVPALYLASRKGGVSRRAVPSVVLCRTPHWNSFGHDLKFVLHRIHLQLQAPTAART